MLQGKSGFAPFAPSTIPNLLSAARGSMDRLLVGDGREKGLEVCLLCDVLLSVRLRQFGKAVFQLLKLFTLEDTLRFPPLTNLMLPHTFRPMVGSQAQECNVSASIST